MNLLRANHGAHAVKPMGKRWGFLPSAKETMSFVTARLKEACDTVFVEGIGFLKAEFDDGTSMASELRGAPQKAAKKTRRENRRKNHANPIRPLPGKKVPPWLESLRSCLEGSCYSSLQRGISSLSGVFRS